MKIAITGALGFVGSNLSFFLTERGHDVIGIGRRMPARPIPSKNYTFVKGDTTMEGEWRKMAAEADGIVNLAGRTIFNIWTKSYKEEIYNSRIQTTKRIVEALEDGKEKVVVSASAVGIYGNRGDDLLTEKEPVGDSFLAAVSRDWENEAYKAREKGARVATVRFGVVLGRNGGAMEKMIPAFKLGLGGPIGGGNHYFPWIHIADLMKGIAFILENREAEGPFNFTGPNTVRQKDFTKALAAELSRPAFLPAPKFMMKTVLGEFGEALMESQKAIPEKLLDMGFSFDYDTLQKALREIVH